MSSTHTLREWLKATPWSEGSSFAILLLRLWLGQEFMFAGYTKLAGGVLPPAWFVQLQFPFPHHLLPTQFNWVMAGVLEVICSVALMVGLGTRVVTVLLLYITYVAVYSVHFDLGWSGWNMIETDAGNGFKIPLMMALMLVMVLTHGPGRWSVDGVLSSRTTARVTVAA